MYLGLPSLRHAAGAGDQRREDSGITIYYLRRSRKASEAKLELRYMMLTINISHAMSSDMKVDACFGQTLNTDEVDGWCLILKVPGETSLALNA
nr:hypothetical protein CFP56_48720 [Quercus suber]